MKQSSIFPIIFISSSQSSIAEVSRESDWLFAAMCLGAKRCAVAFVGFIGLATEIRAAVTGRERIVVTGKWVAMFSAKFV